MELEWGKCRVRMSMSLVGYRCIGLSNTWETYFCGRGLQGSRYYGRKAPNSSRAHRTSPFVHAIHHQAAGHAAYVIAWGVISLLRYMLVISSGVIRWIHDPDMLMHRPMVQSTSASSRHAPQPRGPSLVFHASSMSSSMRLGAGALPSNALTRSKYPSGDSRSYAPSATPASRSAISPRNCSNPSGNLSGYCFAMSRFVARSIASCLSNFSTG